MKKRCKTTLVSVSLALLAACAADTDERTHEVTATQEPSQVGKAVVYQVFTRLFGNSNTTNKPWGTLAQNGVGKFNDFTDEALRGIKELGVTHIWYTGVPHHAVIGDYSAYGISNDDPDVVKGRAGSPYAVRDYYNVNPDLAEDPARRLQEFQALVERTHKHDMKVLIDIVPNHVARNYSSTSKPEGVKDFGANDDTSVEYKRDNNFYYVVGEPFKVPDPLKGYRPLGGEKHPLADGNFDEYPAKWTGNGSRKAQPHFNDWYETVKINYGVRPDGSNDFPSLPAGYEQMDYRAHAAFWQDKDVPDSWRKFRDIATYWLAKGVDGFRYDMAEMVPVEFWSYLNSAIKLINPDAFLLAEVYNPQLYRDYIHLGKMDYLYDKVEFYDTLKPIMQGNGSTDNLPPIQSGLADIEHHMLHFLENHDEQRIASPQFAGNAQKGKPAMVVSTAISTAPTMIYFGQALGADGAGDAGFGDPSRTTIFDYWGVPALQRWSNNGRFDGGQLSESERNLRDFYTRLLSFSAQSPALTGHYADIHTGNRSQTPGYNDRLFSFVRWKGEHRLIVISNFDSEKTYSTTLRIPADIIDQWQLADGNYPLTDQLYQTTPVTLEVKNGTGQVSVAMAPLQSFIYKLPL